MVWLTNYNWFGVRTNGVMNNDDTITNPLNGQVLLGQWGKVDLSPVLWRIVLRRSSRVRVEQCDFHIKLHRTNLLSPNLPRWRFSSGPRLCDPGAVALLRKLTDMKHKTVPPNKCAKHAHSVLDSTSISYKDHNQKTEC